MLATGAALLIRTVDHLRDIDAGLDPQGVLAVDVLLPPEAMGEEERALYFSTLVERARALPGVSSAGLISRLPLRDGGWQGTVRIEDRPDLDDLGRRPNAFWRAVTPETFTALGVRMAQGRGIEPTDVEGTTPVVVVSESFARRMWGTRNPLSRRASDNLWGGDGWVEVVGVVEDIAVAKLVGDNPPAMYVPWAQTLRTNDFAVLVLKATGDPTMVAAPARALVSAVDDRAAVGRAQTMESVMDTELAEPLRLRFFLGLFSLLGIVLGTVGIYGVVSYGVQRRRAEFGIRMALGAEPRRLLGDVIRSGMVPVLLGVAGGLGASLLGSAVLTRYLYGVAPTDVTALAWAAGVLTVAGLLAALVPAWRASGTDPAVALRSE
jgi:predicted permease